VENIGEIFFDFFCVCANIAAGNSVERSLADFGDRFGRESFAGAGSTVKENDEAITFAFDDIICFAFIALFASGSMSIYEGFNKVFFVVIDYETLKGLVVPSNFTDVAS
jgi:hypothetical protein